MILARAITAASIVLVAASVAMAQFPPPPNPSGSPFPPPAGPSGSPFPPPSSPSAAPARSNPFPSPQAPAARPAAQQPSASPFPMPGQQKQANPCEAFFPLRAAAEKDAGAIKAASARKASREEVCPLFRRFAASEAKMVKFLKDNQARCGVPPEAVKQSGANHAKTLQVRNQVCSAGPAPAAPRLSDAFSTPLTASPSAAPNRGTFDTLTGNPLRP